MRPVVIVENVLAGHNPIWSYPNAQTLSTDPYYEDETEISVPAGQENFEFRYTALSFIVPERVKFEYKLEGFDTDWVKAGTRRTAYYTNLAPRRYTFRVKASNDDGVWNEAGASFSFYLRPHFYQTFWFYGLCVLAAAGVVAGGYRIRVRQLKTREAHLVHVVDERTRSLSVEKEKANIQANQMERQAQELETLDRIVRVINQETSLEKLLNSLLEQAMLLFPKAQKGSFLLLDHGDQKFKFASAYGLDWEELKAISLTVEEAVSRYTEGSERLQVGVHIVRKLQEIAGQEKLKHLPVPKSMLAMAVHLAGNLEGFLLLDNMEDAEAFDNSDLQKLSRFQEHAAVAIAKAKLLKELQEKRHEAESQKDAAEKQKEKVQKAMKIIELQTKQLIEAEAEFCGRPLSVVQTSWTY